MVSLAAVTMRGGRVDVERDNAGYPYLVAVSWTGFGDPLPHPIGGQATTVTSVHMLDGTRRQVGPSVPGRGETGDVRAGTVGVASVPDGVALADDDLLTLRAGGDLALTDVMVGDSIAASGHHQITAHALPARVGSCPRHDVRPPVVRLARDRAGAQRYPVVVRSDRHRRVLAG